MTSKVTAKCSHCGFPLSPSYIGPCPRCGKIGKTVMASLVESLNISDVVNASGSAVFASRNIVAPEWWPDAAKGITRDVTKEIEIKFPELLNQHEKAVEAKQNRLVSRLTRIGVTVVWIVVGIILDRVISIFFVH
jgi:hypothetical protein